MNIYSVFKQGVYRHECGGMFSTEEMARSEAMRLIAGEGDDYHQFEVAMYELDKLAPAVEPSARPCRYDDIFDEAGVWIVTYKKKDGVISEIGE